MIRALSSNPLGDIMTANLTTIGKVYNGKEVSLEKAHELVLGEHSTLEFAPFLVSGSYRGDVASHVVRSTKGHPRFALQSARPDWTGKPRPGPEVERKMLSLWNPLSWVLMCRQRLCYKAMHETRMAILHARQEMAHSDDTFFRAVAWASVPDCIASGGCRYGKRSCNWYELAFIEGDVPERYDQYDRLQELSCL
jgi:hypothetical protein